MCLGPTTNLLHQNLGRLCFQKLPTQGGVAGWRGWGAPSGASAGSGHSSRRRVTLVRSGGTEPAAGALPVTGLVGAPVRLSLDPH